MDVYVCVDVYYSVDDRFVYVVYDVYSYYGDMAGVDYGGSCAFFS